MALLWLVPLILVVGLGFDVWRLNHLDHARLAQAHEDAYSRSRSRKPSPVDLDGDHPFDVFAFGGSSLAMGSDTLERELIRAADAKNLLLNLHNYALIGATSGALVERVAEAFADADVAGVKPELLLIYSGHNDYSYPWLDVFYREVGTLTSVQLLWWLRFVESDATVVDDGFPWFQRMRTPAMVKLYQGLGLVHWESADFEPHMSRSLQEFESNLDQILSMSRSRGVPVMLVTPIGNLTWEPFGPRASVTDMFVKGMEAKELEVRVEWLVSARDNEVITADMRAKSALHQSLRDRHGDGVRVLDLQTRLQDQGFDFGSVHFRDYLHFTDSGFAVLAREVVRFWFDDPQLKPIVQPPEVEPAEQPDP